MTANPLVSLSRASRASRRRVLRRLAPLRPTAPARWTRRLPTHSPLSALQFHSQLDSKTLAACTAGQRWSAERAAATDHPQRSQHACREGPNALNATLAPHPCRKPLSRSGVRATIHNIHPDNALRTDFAASTAFRRVCGASVTLQTHKMLTTRALRGLHRSPIWPEPILSRASVILASASGSSRGTCAFQVRSRFEANDARSRRVLDGSRPDKG